MLLYNLTLEPYTFSTTSTSVVVGSVDNKRYTMRDIGKLEKRIDNLEYYWNGLRVAEPILTSKEWGVLGIFFPQSLNFDEFSGAINLNGPILFNNIAYYQANNLQQVQGTITRPWIKVKTEDAINFNWSFWGTNKTWYQTLIVGSSDLYGVNPGDIYRTYLGTNKIIFDDENGLSLDSDKMQIYQDVTWSTSVASAL